MFGVVGEQCFVRFHGALEDCDLSSTLPPTIVKESGSVVCEQLYQTLNANVSSDIQTNCYIHQI